MSNQTFAERCQLAQQCLPDAAYRSMLTKLHAEMLAALAEQPAPAQEPFGYFKPTPFGWTDGAEGDEGAIALYERPAQRAWESLPDEKVLGLFYKFTSATGKTWLELWRETEKELQEKNT